MNTPSYSNGPMLVPGNPERDGAIVYAGRSMHPTFKPLDTLSYSCCDMADLRKGDVIVFHPPASEKLVIHRISHISADSVGTRGDGSLNEDGWTLTGNDILGRVEFKERKGRRVPVRGGSQGSYYAAFLHLLLQMQFFAHKIMETPYRICASSPLFSTVFPLHRQTRIVAFRRNGGDELQLMLGKRVIGRMNRENGTWDIKPPFRLFIDENRLDARLSTPGHICGEESGDKHP
jgi:signal peptidase I